MQNNKKNKNSKMPKITIDESLNRFKGKVIFKATLEKANETLRNVELPMNLKKHFESA